MSPTSHLYLRAHEPLGRGPLDATGRQLDEFERLAGVMARAGNWSEDHQVDKQFHQLVAVSSGLGPAVDAYNEALAELYAYFIPYPIEFLRESNRDHIALVNALRAGDDRAAVEVSRRHVDVLHKTMFMGLWSGISD